MRPFPILLALLLPASASAAWIDHGQVEPGPRDWDAAMWEDGTQGERRIYFNAYPSQYATSVNPNLPEATRLAPFPMHWKATLGVWRDCNADGYVGWSLGALHEYPAALLADAAACPPGEHNVEGTIRELLVLGPSPKTHVWGDLVRPWTDDCRWAPPYAEGTTSQTGRMLAYADCRTAGALLDTMAWSGVDPGVLDVDLPVHPYDNPRTGQTGLVQDGGPPSFVAWDCASGAPAPELRDPRGSYAEAVDHVVDGLDGACDESAPTSWAWAALDAEPDGWIVDPAGRDKTDMLFEFWRPVAPAFGLDLSAGLVGPPAWAADHVYLDLPAVDRTRLALERATQWRFYAHVDLSDPLAADARLPSEGHDLWYGMDNCPWGPGGGLWGYGEELWVCDPDRWYEVSAPEHPYLPRPGDPFHLRDADCLDGWTDHTAGLPGPRRCGVA